MGWFLVLVMLVVQAVFLLTGLSAAKADKGLVLGVSLPQEAMKDPELAGILSGYRKGILLHSLAFLPGVFLAPALESSPFWMIVLLLLWTGVYLFTFSGVFSRWAGEIRELKARKGWGFGGNSGVIAVDTQVIGSKERMGLSYWWMLPALAVAAVPLLCCVIWREQADMYLFAGVTLALQGAFWLCRRSMARSRSTAYCADPDVNRACHYLAIRTWSICWTVAASAFALSMAAAFFFLRRGVGEGKMALLVFLPLLVVLAVTFYGDHRIRKGQNRLLEGQPALETGDTDQYWTPSGFYNNPRDPRLMVDKRWGIGMTLNIGHPAGRILGKGLIVLVALLISVMLVMIGRMEFAVFTMEVRDGAVSISAPFYGASFPLEEIESVALSDTIPPGNKTNGAATGALLLGHFRLEGVGPARLYVHTEDMPCLVIRLPEETVYFTGQTEEETRALYEQLAEALE